MIIDHQAHWYPPAYLESLIGNEGYPRAERGDDGGFTLETAPGQAWPVPLSFVDLDVQIADMDEHGIDRMVVSPGAFGGDTSALPSDEAAATMRLLNTETAGAQRHASGRVIGLAVLPIHDPTASLEVLAEAAELGLRGVSQVANVGQTSIANPELLEVYRQMDALGLPLFLHPAQRSVAAHVGYSPIIEMGLSWMYDTAAAACALVYSGVLDECPRLTIVHPHLGGVLPHVVQRVEAYAANIPSGASEPLSHYLKTRFYTDSVGMTPGALVQSVETYGADRVLFGTDYPWLPRGDARPFIESSVSPDVATAIIEQNTVAGLTGPLADAY